MIIHLNGFPGVGKQTVAEILVEQTRGRLIDNHSIINCAYACTEPRSDSYYRVLDELTGVVYAALGERPQAEIQIFTNALADDIPNDRRRFARIKALAQKRNVIFVPILLTANETVLLNRAVTPSRAEQQKLTDKAVLTELIAQCALLHPNQEPNQCTIDTTLLKPVETAEKILEHLESLSNQAACSA